MDIDVDQQHHDADHGEHPPTTIRQYMIIGLVLAIVTAVELWGSYNEELLGVALIPFLVILSAFKFVAVIALFMHLRFDHPLLTRLFLFGLILALALMSALVALFWYDPTFRP